MLNFKFIFDVNIRDKTVMRNKTIHFWTTNVFNIKRNILEQKINTWRIIVSGNVMKCDDQYYFFIF